MLLALQQDQAIESIEQAAGEEQQGTGEGKDWARGIMKEEEDVAAVSVKARRVLQKGTAGGLSAASSRDAARSASECWLVQEANTAWGCVDGNRIRCSAQWLEAQYSDHVGAPSELQGLLQYKLDLSVRISGWDEKNTIQLNENVASREAFYERWEMFCVCLGGGGSEVPGSSRKIPGLCEATGIAETAGDGPGTTEPVHKGRNGTSNEAQSNPTERSSKSRRLVRGRVKRAEVPKQSRARWNKN
ncbi:hypothetical protein DFH09DRAFT_1079018 [Mycena vulgaris]|nr:hypothetical protein DFH09DRAFT_1079018 [Mycena vulgaris]